MIHKAKLEGNPPVIRRGSFDQSNQLRTANRCTYVQSTRQTQGTKTLGYSVLKDRAQIMKVCIKSSTGVYDAHSQESDVEELESHSEIPGKDLTLRYDNHLHLGQVICMICMI